MQPTTHGRPSGRRNSFWNEFEQRARQLPGVDAAGIITCAPLDGCHLGNFFQVENALPRPDGKNPVVLQRFASSGYFPAAGLRLKAGRFLEDPDSGTGAAPAVVVNETFVRTFWGRFTPVFGSNVRLMFAWLFFS